MELMDKEHCIRFEKLMSGPERGLVFFPLILLLQPLVHPVSSPWSWCGLSCEIAQLKHIVTIGRRKKVHVYERRNVTQHYQEAVESSHQRKVRARAAKSTQEDDK